MTGSSRVERKGERERGGKRKGEREREREREKGERCSKLTQCGRRGEASTLIIKN